jgi:MFS family permease
MATITQAPAGAELPWPSARVGWYAVFVISLSLLVNFLDRGIVPLLVPFIKADLAISDTKMSLIMGFAFIAIYAFAGLPIARYADRGNRKRIITIGLGLWSMATAMCGLARGFASLFAFRAGVGIGEACTGPASFSLLGDLVPPERMARVLAVMNFGFIAGNGLALIILGTLIQLLSSSPTVVLPILGELRMWQAAFVLVGLPGLLVTLLMATVPEPRRRVEGAQPSVSEVAAFLWEHRRVYGPLTLTISINTMAAVGLISWGPAYFIRVWHWDIGTIGLVNGLIWLTVAPIGAMIGGWMAERFARQGHDDANLRVVIYAMAINIPCIILMPLMPNAQLSVTMLGLGVFGASLLFGPQNAAIQVVTPGRMKGQVTAFILFGFNILGYGLGPTVTALFTDYVYQDEMQVGYALATCVAILGPIAFLIMLSGLKPYGRAVAACRDQWHKGY